MKREGIIAAMLAGGRSSRMGQDKALVPYHGRPLFRHGLDVLQSVFSRVVIVGREPGWIEDAGVVCIPDRSPGQGPLAGLGAALELAADIGMRGVFVVGCDMPFLRPAAVELVAGRLTDVHAAIPVVDGYLQTLHAAYSVACRPVVSEMLSTGERSMRGLAARLTVDMIGEDDMSRVDPGLRSVASLNRVEDLQ